MSSFSYPNPVFPPPSPGVQSALIRTQFGQSPTWNNLRVYSLGLPALRRVRVIMKVSPMTNQVTVPPRLWVNCFCGLNAPQRDLAPIGLQPNNNEIHFAPSLVVIPSLGAPIMSILELFLPKRPSVSYVNFYFSLELKDPNAETYVFAYPDGRPHDFDGLFLTPYGSGVFLRRKPRDGGDDDDEHAIELEEGVERDTRKEQLTRINPGRKL